MKTFLISYISHKVSIIKKSSNQKGIAVIELHEIEQSPDFELSTLKFGRHGHIGIV